MAVFKGGSGKTAKQSFYGTAKTEERGGGVSADEFVLEREWRASCNWLFDDALFSLRYENLFWDVLWREYSAASLP